MSLKQRWLRCLPAGLLLAAMVLCAVWLVQPRTFLTFAPLDKATEIHIFTTDAGETHRLQEARPTQAELQPLLEVLSDAEVKLVGRSRNIQWQTEDTLYRLFAGHDENGTWYVDADLDLCTDGSLYVYKGWIGHLRYQLVNCDLNQVNVALAELVGIDRSTDE